MEPETNEVNSKNSWNTVTSLSKYLAMILFIALPFIGGYVGFVYAPVQTIEVPVIVESVEPEPIITQDNKIEDWLQAEVSLLPGDIGPGDDTDRIKSSKKIPWGSYVGKIKGLKEENGNLYLGFDEVKFYKVGGSCWSINGYCVIDAEQKNLKLQLEGNTRLTRNSSSLPYNPDIPCQGLKEITLTPDITEDALGVETACSGTVTQNTLFSDRQYYWLFFTDKGTVSGIVEQYIP